MNIREKLEIIQTEMKAPKGQYNKFGKYSYRKAEDILEAVKPYLSKLHCTVLIDEEFIQGITIGDLGIIKSTATLSDSESEECISVSSSAGVEKNGGMQLPQAFGSSSSYAKKYALGNLFAIDNEEDPDSLPPQPKKEAVPPVAKTKLSPRDTEKWKAAVDVAKKAKSTNPITSIRILLPADLDRLKKEAGLA
jgi:hypothetical protein